MNSESEKEKFQEFFRLISVNMLFNTYSLENIVMGKLKPDEQIPMDNFVSELKLQALNPYSSASDLEGSIIDNEGVVKDCPIETYYYRFFADQMNIIFLDAPKFSDEFGDDLLFRFKNNLCKYITDMYPMFKEILATEVTYEPFDLVPLPTEKTNFHTTGIYVRDLVADIKIKRMKKGQRVDKLMKNIPYISNYYFVNRLLENKDNHYVVADNDTDGVDYKLALFSSMDFVNIEHYKIFNLKLKEWERKYKENAKEKEKL